MLFGLRNATWVNQETLYYLSQNIILFVLLTIASTPMIRLIGQKLFNSPYGSVIKAFIVPMICLLILIASTAYLVDSSYNPFLYFRF